MILPNLRLLHSRTPILQIRSLDDRSRLSDAHRGLLDAADQFVLGPAGFVADVSSEGGEGGKAGAYYANGDFGGAAKIDALKSIGLIDRVSVLNDPDQPHNGRHADHAPRRQNSHDPQLLLHRELQLRHP